MILIEENIRSELSQYWSQPVHLKEGLDPRRQSLSRGRIKKSIMEEGEAYLTTMRVWEFTKQGGGGGGGGGWGGGGGGGGGGWGWGGGGFWWGGLGGGGGGGGWGGWGGRGLCCLVLGGAVSNWVLCARCGSRRGTLLRPHRPCNRLSTLVD